MPGFDGTGPLGQGPRTGRGLGYCAPGLGFGRGYGLGRGRGLGRGLGRELAEIKTMLQEQKGSEKKE